MKKIQRVKTGNELTRKIIAVLTGYIKAQLIIVTVVSLVIWLILSFLGVKYALLLALMTGSLSVIPFAGMTTAAIITALFTIFDGIRFLPSLHPVFEGLTILVIYLVVNLFIDYVLSPYVTGKITNVHPLILLASVITGTLLFGVPGTFLAIPAVLVFKTILEYREEKR
jgi:predicted PurR-regulated permease PerM